MKMKYPVYPVIFHLYIYIYEKIKNKIKQNIFFSRVYIVVDGISGITG